MLRSEMWVPLPSAFRKGRPVSTTGACAVRRPGWEPRVAVGPDADLESDEFLSAVLRRFGKVERAIDQKLEGAT